MECDDRFEYTERKRLEKLKLVRQEYEKSVSNLPIWVYPTLLSDPVSTRTLARFAESSKEAS
jgi:hypothetical protein